MTKKRRSSQAVSEVVGVILLLGITLGLFGFLNYVVFSFSFQPSAPSVNLVGSIDITKRTITIEHNGGEPLDENTRISVEFNDITYNDQRSIRDFVPGGTIWKFYNKNDDTKWNFGETVQYCYFEDITITRVIVIDPSTNTLILSLVP